MFDVHFNNRIIDHDDFTPPGPSEMLARCAIAHAMQAFEGIDFARTANEVHSQRLVLVYMAGAFVDSQAGWVNGECRIGAKDMIGDIVHSFNHQNQDVTDMELDQWWELS